MTTWFLIPLMFTFQGWVLAPEDEGWVQEPQNGGYEECVLRRDYLNAMMEGYHENRFRLVCRPHLVEPGKYYELDEEEREA